jgi:hypothetical protein
VKHVIAIDPLLAPVHASSGVHPEGPTVSALRGLRNRRWDNGDATDSVDMKLRFVEAFREHPQADVVLLTSTAGLFSGPERVSNVMRNLRCCRRRGCAILVFMDGDAVHDRLLSSRGDFALHDERGRIVFRVVEQGHHENSKGAPRRAARFLQRSPADLARQPVSVFLDGVLHGGEAGDALVSWKALEPLVCQQGFAMEFSASLDEVAQALAPPPTQILPAPASHLQTTLRCFRAAVFARTDTASDASQENNSACDAALATADFGKISKPRRGRA